MDTALYADLPYLFAVAAFGFGLSLATYRFFAQRYGWPMGEWHVNRPALPILIGLIALAFGAFYAWARGSAGFFVSGWSIAILGMVLGLLWTAMMRVGSQVSLVLAPASAALLFVAWFVGTDALEYRTVRSEIRDLRDQLRQQNVLPQPRPKQQ